MVPEVPHQLSWQYPATLHTLSLMIQKENPEFSGWVSTLVAQTVQLRAVNSIVSSEG